MLTIGVGNYVIFATILFVIGVVGLFVNKKNVINILMCVEIILLSVNINFVSFSIYHNNLHGQIFSFFILTVAAAEAAIGLAILVCFYRNKRTILVDEISELKG